MKITSSDILAVLRRFNIASEDNLPRNIEQVSVTEVDEHCTVASFRFSKECYFLIMDSTAEDDVDYILQQIMTIKQDVRGELLLNPNDSLSTYGLPFKNKDVYLYKLKSDKVRLDSYLAEKYSDTSRSTWQKRIKAGQVRVNGEIETSAKLEVTDADNISVEMPNNVDHSKEELPILYFDDNVIVVNKPIGVLTHSKGVMNEEFTVADFFRRYTTYNLDTNRPGIVHRLDRDTSGIIIGARNPETAIMLQRQFSERTAKKSYVAIVEGVLKQDKAKVDLPIGRNPTSPSTFRVDSRGKRAITYYEVLDSTGDMSIVDLGLATGRTHQLRVHMSYIGNPILGDRIYGTKRADRLYLHAYRLEITIPHGNRKVFNVEVPIEFKNKFPKIKV